jgi:hypothetical protein
MYCAVYSDSVRLDSTHLDIVWGLWSCTIQMYRTGRASWALTYDLPGECLYRNASITEHNKRHQHKIFKH